MPALNFRNLSEDPHRALRVRAVQKGRSTEAEVRAILEAALQPNERIKLGSLVADIGAKFGGVDLSLARDKAAIEPAAFN